MSIAFAPRHSVIGMSAGGPVIIEVVNRHGPDTVSVIFTDNQGRSGDGGIDGKGIYRIGGFLSFHVYFQCKRYAGSVSAGAIRDFRGAIVGRADKGLFVTTGTFTRDAVREATRDGAPPIDLMDGDQLADKLRELKLGVSIEVVEVHRVERDWLLAI